MARSRSVIRPTADERLDVFANPDASIGEIAARTGLPQSHASESVARFRDKGAFETRPDPSDGRRTLVRLSSSVPQTIARFGTVAADGALVEALGDVDRGTAADLVAALESVAALLRKANGDPDSPAGQLARMAANQRG